MRHRITDRALVPLVWNDEQNMWEIDPEAPKGPLAPSQDQVDEPECDCTYGAGRVTDQEHDEQWGRAVAADLPTLDDLWFLLTPQRDVSWNLKAKLGIEIRRVMPDIDQVTLDSLIQRMTLVSQSVDQNAYLRGKAER